jgi:NADPH-dependent 2,4-dienoyl-CoA reductase/sulfur reductase-like enzyme
MKIVILGGGAAGATAAQFARKQSRDAEIIVFEKGPYPEYSRCGMPSVLSRQIPSFESLVEFSADWFERNRIDLRLSTEVRSIDVQKRIIEVEGSGGRRFESYDALIFATGSAPSTPLIGDIQEGNQLRRGVFQFRGIDDARALQNWCAEKKRDALIVGAGLVGLEVADALNHNSHKVSVVEYLDSILPAMIDPDMAEPVASAAREKGVEIVTSSTVDSISDQGAKISSRAGSGSRTITCDTIIIATGQKPGSALAEKAGCALGKNGHIKVNECCGSSIEGIFAAGDCSEYKDMVTGEASPAGLGTLAVKMGEIAGRNAAGGSACLPRGFLSSRVTRLFGLEIAATGPLSSSLLNMSMKPIQSRVKGSTLPPYFPGGEEMLVKLTASENGRLLSCQIVGAKEAALRIDIVSSFIAAGLGAKDLAQLENAYAPPVAPCIDVLAAAAQGILIKIERKGQ